MGFTANRIVRANSPEEAETIARGSIVRDPRLVSELLNGSRDPSSLEVETIRKLGLFKSLSSSTHGFEFFFEDLPETPDPTGEPQ